MKCIEADKSMRIKSKFSKFVELINSGSENPMKILVFSAGIKGVIEEKLKNVGIPTDNMVIVANDICFDTRKLKSDKITSLNKSSEHLPEGSISQNASWFVLIGDSLHDHNMLNATEIASHQKILKIGLLNRKDVWESNGGEVKDFFGLEDSLKSFHENYDILIVNDEHFDFALNLF